MNLMKRLQDLSTDTLADDAFAGEVMLVTGAGAGIGRALAIALAQHGATVVLLGEVIAELEEVYDLIVADGAAEPAIYPANLAGTTPADLQNVAATIQEQLGRLDALIHNAGWIGGFRPFSQTVPERYQQIMNINLHSPFWLTHACLPLLREANFGRLLFTLHDAVRPYYGAFGVAKHASSGFMQLLADEFGSDEHFLICGIDPGPVDTQMRRTHFPGEDWSQWPAPESVVPAFLQLLADRARDYHGKVLCLEGNSE